MCRSIICSCVVVLVLIGQLSKAQGNQKSSSGESKESLPALLLKSREYLDIHPDTSLAYAKEATKVSRDLNDISGQAESALLEAMALSIKEDYDLARTAYTRSINRFTRAADTSGQLEAVLGLGSIEMETRNYSTALQQFRDAEGLAKLPKEFGRIHTLNGMTFQRLGSFDLAYDHYKQALVKYTEAGDSVAMANSHSNLGGIMFELEDFDAALESFNNALAIQLNQKDKQGEMKSRCKIGTVQLQRKQYRTAEVSHKSSLSIAHELGSPRGIADNCQFLGDVALGAGKPDTAESRYLQALQIWEEPGIHHKVAEARLGLARALLAKGEPKDAIENAESAVESASEVHNWEMISEARMVQSKAAEQMRDFEQALAYERFYDFAQVQIFEQEKLNKALEMKVRFDHDAAVKLLEVEKQLQDADLARQGEALKQGRMIGYGLVALICIIGIFSFFLYRTAQKRSRTNRLLEERSQEVTEKNTELKAAQKQLEVANNNLEIANNNLESLVDERTEALKNAVEGLVEVNQELDTFIYRASHDLLGPIARLKGLSMLLKVGAEDNKYANLIDDVAVYMDKALRKLILVHDIRKPHKGTEPVDLQEVYAGVEHGLKDIPGIEEPQVNLQSNVEGTLPLHPKLIRVILENLLENACIFRRDPQNATPQVNLSLIRENGELIVETRDEGIGIPSEIQDKVFNIFYRGSERSKGSGTGLYLVKLSAEHMGGDVKLESVEGEYTSVRVRIPIKAEPEA